jgi:hypothetical protein
MKLLFAFVVLLSGVAHAESPVLPTLFFEYSWLYDSVCSNTPERKIDPAWADEAKRRTPEFTATWSQAGPVLFGKVFEMFGRGFQRKEFTATLSVCPAPSYSNPLILNVTRFLRSYMGTRPVRSNDSFNDLVFHELLHTWLSENLGFPTPLIQKYENEEPTVRSHLHLMAMQKYIYSNLNRQDLLNLIDSQYQNMPVPAYNRAWKIVSQIEGYEPFIAEIPR